MAQQITLRTFRTEIHVSPKLNLERVRLRPNLTQLDQWTLTTPLRRMRSEILVYHRLETSSCVHTADP